ncbi:type I-B CRISPR-associated protein Cas5b [Halalkalibacterium halodurans]|uniref:type I-B CRISPR-associated protein Cas5b n=1 Tax=Halalkalibacterium halodurans TaxID=86665 RepID=UPI002AAA17B5|nr:type I-B CRISPR-associated protein Cas5b [Halalkalibacterium halodurans]MDY7220843.1 type I-B CRISPR-associated protein Cas5b [Halalkalibacterium halodurans]MDY7240082.1 type I-B CRISPR-associated protein Cas5b [Halalkalibacterium halodurans]MED3648443.1 type I-B CRISPR-associated protein Cas5b [Halalkalibacterium halodurans]MED4083217.1 type I-B CRISPR-associated protein Cas5b [Halalkalibacterium halodurans]MED4087075.1 type I-B CRISPR-associated protein Cas5b [Halalkalibacterium haloduran
MKVLRLKLYQETACYKKPFAFKVSETYPLPPYSTVKGMLHAALNATSLIPMRYSIQGKYDTLVTDYQTHYFFKKSKTEEFVLTTAGLGIEREFKDLTSMPIYMHLLYDVELLIHVSAEEEVLHQLKEAILSSDCHLSLGRWEDLIRVDECEVVETKQVDYDITLESYSAFVPEQWLDEGDYFPYKLNSTYRSLDGNVRVWDKIAVGYVQPGYTIEEPLIDSYGDCVLLHN